MVLVLLAASFVSTLVFLYMKSQGDAPAAKTKAPVVTDIVKKAVATGSIVPRREVQIKPRVSGIVKTLFVEPGDVVEEGALIAEIKIVPDMAALTRAESQLRSAQIARKHAELELSRAQRAHDKGLASAQELADRRLTFDLRQAELAAAAADLKVVRDGAARQDQTANTKVRSTVAGMVLEVPVEEGGSVIETNTFNEGTTIATVADMGDMIFLGHVDEADVDKIRAGMDVVVRIGAIDNRSFSAKLEYIAPKGETLEGAIQFEIKAALAPVDDAVIRAGYSANAEIVLERRDQVLAVEEALLQFEGDRPFVEIETAPGTVERRDLELGISDGIHVEVKSGVEAGAKVRAPEATQKKGT